ncbi:MAG: hypothetical protein ABIQ74_08830 [Chitinophagales bacterium]
MIAAIAAFVLAACYLLFQYKATRLLKDMVETQSQGQYHLNARQVILSPFKCRLQLKNASIEQQERNFADTRSIIRLPALYLQLRSWSFLFSDDKLFIDTVSLVAPVFETFVNSNSEINGISIQTANFFKGLQQVVQLLNVRSFHLENGSFILHPYHASVPFSILNINFSIRNFGRAAGKRNSFMSADDIDLLIPHQEWKINDGNHEIRFNRIHFSGKDQYFELDSCTFISYGTDKKSDVALSIDKVSFRSDSLFAIYKNNELIIDTLTCQHPVLAIHINGDQARDSAIDLRESLKNFFINLHIQHIDIDSGQLSIVSTHDGRTSNYTSLKNDLKIDDLSIRPDESPFLTTGNINMQLKELVFFTPDSLFQLKVEEFDLYNNEIHFKNAFFSPTNKNHHLESFSVMIPVLSLHQLNLEDLLEKKLGADVAEMKSPIVIIKTNRDKKSDEHGDENLAGFYNALHGLSLLLRVNLLNISNGIVNYESLSDNGFTADMKDFNASILLNDFLNSASLIDIKHSAPFIHVAQIGIHSDAIDATANELLYRGSQQHNGIGRIEFQASDKILIKGKDVYWQKLNWEELKSNGSIIADSIYAGELSVSTFQNTGHDVKNPATLPVVNIRKLNAEKLSMNLELNDAQLHGEGEQILVTALSTTDQHFFWEGLSGMFRKTSFKTSQLTLTADQITLNAPGKTSLSGVIAGIKNQTVHCSLTFPEVEVTSAVSNTDFSNIQFQTVNVDNPVIGITQSPHSSSGHSVKIPLAIATDYLRINHAKVNYTFEKPDDTVTATSISDITILNFSLNAESSAFQSIDVKSSEVAVQNRNVKVVAPNLLFQVKNGEVLNEAGRMTMKGLLSGQWDNAGLSYIRNDSSVLRLSEINGSVDPISLSSVQVTEWNKLLQKTNIKRSHIVFNSASHYFSCNNASWNSQTGTVAMKSISFQPKDSVNDFFEETAYQTDYIKLNGDSLALSGFDLDRLKSDSTFRVRKIYLTGSTAEVTRDKTIPFIHGEVKLMPTQLIYFSHSSFNIDSVVIKNSTVNYHERSSLTNREGLVPVNHINALIRNLRNDRKNIPDTLFIVGKAQFLDTKIPKFSYQEAYSDSLSSFTLVVKASATPLTDFSKITNPLAAIDINSGWCDTIVARISGNKYAAIGQMQFYYHDLKISLLNKEDTLNKRLALSFVNFIANRFVIKTNNQKRSSIFFVRNQEKFIFSYWNSILLSGILSSAGIKSNRKYYKEYQRMKEQYKLPEGNF